MSRLKILSVAMILVGLLNGCARPIVLTGSETEAIHPDEVRLFFTQRPDCSYEKVGFLRVSGGYYSRSSLFRAMQREAAKVGADGVYVQEVRQLDILEYIGTATAIRCNARVSNNYLSS